MKKILLLFTLAILTITMANANDFEWQKSKKGGIKGKVHEVPARGGWLNLANGIEGKKVCFGFQFGGAVATIDANKVEACNIGGRANLFIYGIVPKTKTFCVGVDLGAFYMLTSSKKYAKILSASARDMSEGASQEPEVSVSNWMLPTAQISFMGNFHPLQRFNIQIKLNLGAMMAMVPGNTADYYQKEIQADGSYQEQEYKYEYQSGMKPGFIGELGTDLLYAMSAHSEVKFGVDWSYLRFSYNKNWTIPEEKTEKMLTQFGIFDIHIGFAFNF